MPNLAKNNPAELTVRVSQIIYPSIHYSRIACLDSMMTSSEYEWRNGKLISASIPYHSEEKYKQITKAVKNGTAPTLDEVLWEHQLKNSNGDKVKAKRFVEMTHESFEVPKVFYLCNAPYAPIRKIPENVHPSFLALCVEYLKTVLEAKTDFDERTILNKSDLRLHFGKSGKGLDEAELSSRKELSQEISKILAEVDGKTWPPDKERAEKEEKEWNERYSPAARARRANRDNQNSKKIAEEILEDLKKRNLIVT